MKYLTAGLVVIVLVYVSVALTADCVGKADGNYQLSCISYYTCLNGGNASVHFCPTPPDPNVVFNSVTGKCDSLQNVSLPCGGVSHFDCSMKADGDYADTKFNCTSFAICYNGKLGGYQHCSADLVFDEAVQTCNWKERVAPPCGTKV